MKDLRELITPEQKSLIEDYIENYAINDDSGSGSVHYGRRAPVDTILAPWADAKGTSILGALFKDSLIISEQIQFHTPEDEIYRLLDKDNRIYTFEQEYRVWMRRFEEKYRETHENWETWYDIGNALWELINHRVIIDNRYDGDTVNVPIPSGDHDIVIAKGCKPVKMLGKLNAAFHISEKFEAYRIAVSLALNTKAIKGNLCLSIHPMDFMTMSDNDCDWDSCMSWRNCGSYRQGTVEMMNSPYVIVAYLAASEPMRIFNHEWSNKKWRSLFIVHPDFIGNIKGYPYQIPEVDKMIVEKLKKMMADAGFGAQYGPVQKYEYGEFIDENGVVSQLNFHTGYMYNDFGTIPHYGCVRTDKYSEHITITYSGQSECMWCGSRYDEDTEEGLACSYCYDETRCDCCGDRYHESSLFETGNGEWVCENCLAEYYSKSFRNDEYYRTEDMARVTVVPDQYKPAIEAGIIDPLKFDWDAPYILDHMVCNLRPDSNWDLDQFKKEFLEKSAEVHFVKKDGWYGSSYVAYIYFSELNSRARDDFDGRYGYCSNMLGASFIRQWHYLDYYFTNADSETIEKWIKTLDEEVVA